jgi:hypothetical protein
VNEPLYIPFSIETATFEELMRPEDIIGCIIDGVVKRVIDVGLCCEMDDVFDSIGIEERSQEFLVAYASFSEYVFRVA